MTRAASLARLLNASNQLTVADIVPTGNTILGDAGSDTITFNANTLAIPNNLNIDSDTMFIDASNNNVGIGTNTPWSQLTVGSGGTANPDSTVSIHKSSVSEYRLKLTSATFNSDGAWLGLGFGYSNNYMKAAIIAEAKDIFARTNLHFCLDSNANSANAELADSKMVLDYSGNLGLGVTPSPWGSNYKAIQINDTGMGLYSFRSGATGDEYAYLVSNSYNTNTNDIYIRDGFATMYRQFNGTHAWLSSPSGTAGNAITFTQRMTLDASGNLNVGGTSATGAYRVAITGVGTAGNPVAGIVFRQGVTDTLYLGNIQSDNTTDVEMWNPRNGYLRFATNNAERMRITSAGDVGVGTTSPNLNSFNKELTVSAGTSGTARAGINIQGSRTTDSTFGALSYYHQANLVGSIEMIRSGGVDNSGAMQFFTSNAGTIAEHMRIDSSGNVGIGTSTPQSKMQVSSGANPYVVQNSGRAVYGIDIQATAGGSGAFGGAISFGNGGAGRSAISAVQGTADADTAGLAFFTHTSSVAANDAVEAMRISHNGNIGIGTSSPAAKLDVFGNSRIAYNSSGNTFAFVQSGSNSIQLYTDGVTNGVYASGAAIPMTLSTNGTEKMRITSGGDVGIGTTSPGAKLAVTDVGNGTQVLLTSAAGTNIRYDTGRNFTVNRNWLVGCDWLSEGQFAIIPSTALGGSTFSAAVMAADSTGNFRFNSGYGSAGIAYGCRAWVNFNGTGTVAIRASGNVSSITDNGTGDYTVNFVTALVDVNYATTATGQNSAATQFGTVPNVVTRATTSVRLYYHNSPEALRDGAEQCVVVHR